MIKEALELGYEAGLEDAWECARKILKSECSTMKYIFHTAYYPEIILNNSPTEAIAKIKEYEEQEKQTEEKTDKSCESCSFADLQKYEFPCSACSASHTFRWEPRKGASE
jgi:ribulose kinase